MNGLYLLVKNKAAIVYSLLKQCSREGVDDRRQSSDHDKSITATSHSPFVEGKDHQDETKLSGEGLASKKHTGACGNDKGRDYSSGMIVESPGEGGVTPKKSAMFACNSGGGNDGSINNNRKRKPDDNKLNETIGSMKKKSTVAPTTGSTIE